MYVLLLPEIHTSKAQKTFGVTWKENAGISIKKPQVTQIIWAPESNAPSSSALRCFSEVVLDGSIQVLKRSCVCKAEVHWNMHYNVRCLITRPSVKNWNPWSRSSLRRGRTQQVYWLCSRLRISWQRTYQMSTLQHLKEEWLH